MYLQGARDALTAFAVWRDGKQHVNDMRTLGEAIDIVHDGVPGPIKVGRPAVMPSHTNG